MSPSWINVELYRVSRWVFATFILWSLSACTMLDWNLCEEYCVSKWRLVLFYWAKYGQSHILLRLIWFIHCEGNSSLCLNLVHFSEADHEASLWHAAIVSQPHPVEMMTAVTDERICELLCLLAFIAVMYASRRKWAWIFALECIQALVLVHSWANCDLRMTSRVTILPRRISCSRCVLLGEWRESQMRSHTREEVNVSVLPLNKGDICAKVDSMWHRRPLNEQFFYSQLIESQLGLYRMVKEDRLRTDRQNLKHVLLCDIGRCMTFSTACHLVRVSHPLLLNACVNVHDSSFEFMCVLRNLGTASQDCFLLYVESAIHL